MEEQSQTRPKEQENTFGETFSELFGNTANAVVLENMLANPERHYTLKELQEKINAPIDFIEAALQDFIHSKLVLEDKSKGSVPLYYINQQSHQALALTLLAYAVNDDRKGTIKMDIAIQAYVQKSMFD